MPIIALQFYLAKSIRSEMQFAAMNPIDIIFLAKSIRRLWRLDRDFGQKNALGIELFNSNFFSTGKNSLGLRKLGCEVGIEIAIILRPGEFYVKYICWVHGCKLQILTLCSLLNKIVKLLLSLCFM